MQIEVTRGYDMNSWHEDLRRFYLKPGAYAEPATFLFTDTQIVQEEFLEDINNTLNSGNNHMNSNKSYGIFNKGFKYVEIINFFYFKINILVKINNQAKFLIFSRPTNWKKL